MLALPSRPCLKYKTLLRASTFFNLNTNNERRRKISGYMYSKREDFLAALPSIISTITSSDRFEEVPETKQWVEKLINYNSTGGKKTRGLMTVCAYEMLEESRNITEENMKQAYILGWCVELIQTCMLIADDIIDGSLTRRGQTCWYKLPEVGMRALNDSSCLVAFIFDILRLNFMERPYYTKLVDIFNEAFLQTSIGQHLDFINARNFSRFSEINYNKMATFKTTYYTFKLPILISLLLSNKSSEDVFKNIEDILSHMGLLTMIQSTMKRTSKYRLTIAMNMGRLYHSQNKEPGKEFHTLAVRTLIESRSKTHCNDFMDCYGEESVSGKIGTDIQEGKCTWLAVKALQQCTEGQRRLFLANYGSGDEQRVYLIRDLYNDLQLPALYYDTERATYDKVVRSLQSLPTDNVIPSALILKLFHMVYRLRCNTQNDTFPEL